MFKIHIRESEGGGGFLTSLMSDIMFDSHEKCEYVIISVGRG